MKFTTAWISVSMMTCALSAQSKLDSPAAAIDPAASTKSVESLIQDLSDDRFAVREKASHDLWELGDKVLPALKPLVNSNNPELAYRAKELIRKIELYIRPDTNPELLGLIEKYPHASLTEKAKLLDKLRDLSAWRQMLKLYAEDTDAKSREKFSRTIHDISLQAAREQIRDRKPDEARKMLEMAPADTESLINLAEFHRTQGTLEQELKRVKDAPGTKPAQWRLALQRAAGNTKAAEREAVLANEPMIEASMAALSGDPLPWLKYSKNIQREEQSVSRIYAEFAAKRWRGEAIDPSSMAKLVKMVTETGHNRNGPALNALFLLGKIDIAESLFAKDTPLDAYQHFMALERIPEALELIGVNPKQLINPAWIRERMTALSKDDANDDLIGQYTRELIFFASFLESRGLANEAIDLYTAPMLEYEKLHKEQFLDFLSNFLVSNESIGGASILARHIGALWAGDDPAKWSTLVQRVLGEDENANEWRHWIASLDPKASRSEQLDALLALNRIGPDSTGLRDRWLKLAWSAIEKAPENDRNHWLTLLSDNAMMTGDVTTSIRAWSMMPKEAQDHVFWGQQVVHLSAAGKWEEAAAIILEQIDIAKEQGQLPTPDLHAYAASALRKAGKADEAKIHDKWVDQLCLGDPASSIRVANGYAYGFDYVKASEWWARAALLSDPDSNIFVVAANYYGESLQNDGKWMESASLAEVIAMFYMSTNYRTDTPLAFMRQRLKADTSRALGIYKNQPDQSLELLESCHRDFATDGGLADFFFPALLKAGLKKQHDQWFSNTWNLMTAVIKQYPGATNTKNTTAWFAARSQTRLNEAEELMTSILAHYPNQSAYLDTMAEIQFAKGKRADAIKWSKRAVLNNPVDTQLRRQRLHFENDPLP